MEQGPVQKQDGDCSGCLCSFRWSGHPRTLPSLLSKGICLNGSYSVCGQIWGMGPSRKISLNSPSLCQSEPKYLGFWFISDFNYSLSLICIWCPLIRVRVGPMKHSPFFVQRNFSSLGGEKDGNLKELVLQNELKVGVWGGPRCALYHPGRRSDLLHHSWARAVPSSAQWGSVWFRDNFCLHWALNRGFVCLKSWWQAFWHCFVPSKIHNSLWIVTIA